VKKLVDSDSKYKYLAKNVILFSISSFGSKILSFLFVSLYTTVLTTEEYGTADLVWTTASLLLFVVTINISEGVLRFGLEKTDKQEGIFSFGLRVIFKGQLMFGICLLFFGYFNPIHWEWYLYLFLYITVFVNALYQITTYYLRTFDEVKSVAVAGVMSTAVTIFSNVLLLLVFKTGVVGYLVSMVIGCFVATVYALTVIIRRGKFNWTQICDGETKHMMITYSVPLIFNGISWWMNNSLDRYLVTFFCGVSVNGIYAVASKIPALLTTVQGVFSQAWSISAIKEFDKDDTDGFFGNIYTLYNGFSVLGASVLVLFNVFIARILFSSDFFVAWECSSVLVVSAVFSGVAGIAGGIFSKVRKTGYYALSTGIAAVVNTLLNIILIPRFGALGAATATLVSFIIVWMIRVIYVGKFIAWKIDFLRDIVAYCLLGIQLVFDHVEGHFYIGQAVVLIVLVVLYRGVVGKGIRLIIR
jgi:O-antigen/teichoic acid export membrane protein